MSWRINSEDVIIEIVIRESSGAKIESYKLKVNDEKKTRSIMGLLKHKYGFCNFPKRDKDITWLDKQNW